MKNIYSAIFLFVAIFFINTKSFSQISLTGSVYTQDFNTLANTGTSSTVPTGWLFSEAGTNANTTYTAGSGTGTAGDTYSWGTGTNADRAFGGLLSGSLTPTIGASFTNNTGSTVTSLTISYTGEQWRLGATARIDQLDFQYSLDATSLTTGTWTDVNSLDFVAPVQSGVVGALDGNAAPNRTIISFTIPGLSIANGTTFYIRWNDFNAAGSDDGLGVDDFSISTGTGVSASLSLSSGGNASEPSTNGSFTATFSPATTSSTTFNYNFTGTATFSADYSVSDDS